MLGGLQDDVSTRRGFRDPVWWDACRFRGWQHVVLHVLYALQAKRKYLDPSDVPDWMRFSAKELEEKQKQEAEARRTARKKKHTQDSSSSDSSSSSSSSSESSSSSDTSSGKLACQHASRMQCVVCICCSAMAGASAVGAGDGFRCS